MRVLALIVVGFVLALVLAGMIGGGGGRGLRQRARRARAKCRPCRRCFRPARARIADSLTVVHARRVRSG